jgi:hypothetical protein
MRHKRHSYRSWLDAVGTAIAVQQKLMRYSDIRTALNIYGDVVTNEMAEAHAKGPLAVPHLRLDNKVVIGETIERFAPKTPRSLPA